MEDGGRRRQEVGIASGLKRRTSDASDSSGDRDDHNGADQACKDSFSSQLVPSHATLRGSNCGPHCSPMRSAGLHVTLTWTLTLALALTLTHDFGKSGLTARGRGALPKVLVGGFVV